MFYLAFGIGLPEVLVTLAVVLVLFGAKKLPELARAMGSSINQFKKGLAEEEQALKQEEEAKRLAEKKEAENASELGPRDEPAVVVEKEETSTK